MSYLFGFNARIGRLHYFLSTILLGVVITVMMPSEFVAMAGGIADAAKIVAAKA